MQINIQNIEKLANLIIEIYIEEGYKPVLQANKKVVTRRTFNSFEGDFTASSNNLRIVLTADKALFYIENGKRANTKLPVKKVGGTWQLVERLEEWKDAVNFGGTDYQLAYSIAKNRREGIDISGQAKQRVNKKILEAISTFFRTEIPLQITEQLKEIWRF